MRYLYYVDPHPTGGTCYVKLTEEQAVEWQKKIHDYKSDGEALDDFIVVHWASYEPFVSYRDEHVGGH